MSLGAGLVVEPAINAEGTSRVAGYLSGVSYLDWKATMAPAQLVAITGWARFLRLLAITTALISVVLAFAYLLVATAIEDGEPQFESATAALAAPTALLAGLMAGGMALWPFITRPSGITEAADEEGIGVDALDYIGDFDDIRDVSGLYDFDAEM
jgi:hypothetical protein